MRRRLKANASPSMVIACIAVILAMTGSAFAASALITGADVKDGSLTRADLSRGTIRSLRGRRGPRGRDGQDGFVGPEGPQGSTGPQGPVGPAGPRGEKGDKGNTGDPGAPGARGPQGVQGPQGNQGDPGPQGTPGQSVQAQLLATPASDIGNLRIGSTGPDRTEGTELTGGAIYLPAGQYLIHVGASFTNPDGADASAQYGVLRLFLSDSPLDGGVTSPPFGGSADADTTLVSADIPDDRTTPAQVSGTFVLGVGDDQSGNGGELLTLRAANLTDGADRANVTAHFVVTRIG